MKNLATFSLLGAMSLLSALGCSVVTEEEGAVHDSEAPELPRIAGGICTPEPEPLGACEWAASADAVAWVVVDAVQFSPVWEPNQSDAGLIESCTRGHAGLELHVEIMDVLYGDLPSNLVVNIGGDVTGPWSMTPKPDGDGDSVSWRGMDSLEAGPAPAVEDPFYVGRRLGIALHYDEQDERWTTLGERLFTVTKSAEDEDVVYFQQTVEPYNCNDGRDAPEELDGSTVSVFDDVVRSCEQTEAAAVRKELIQADFVKPAMSFAGRCWSTEPSGEPAECRSDDECEIGELS